MRSPLTLHRLVVYGVLGRSLKTTNCLESVNSLVEERCAKVDSWKNSGQKQRWLTTALLEIEPRLWKIKGHKYLPEPRAAIQRDLKIEVVEHFGQTGGVINPGGPWRISTKNGIDSFRLAVRRPRGSPSELRLPERTNSVLF